jgi:hypothetical protein
MLWTCLHAASKLIAPSFLLLYLNGLKLSFSFVTFLCWSSLRYCDTSDLLNFQKSSYNTSRVFGHSLTRWMRNYLTRNALIACVMACSSETYGACALSWRNLQKKSGSISLSYNSQEKKSSSVVISTWKPWKLTTNFSFSCAQEMIDLGGSLAYHFAAAFWSDMINDFTRVVSSLPNEALTAL